MYSCEALDFCLMQVAELGVRLNWGFIWFVECVVDNRHVLDICGIYCVCFFFFFFKLRIRQYCYVKIVSSVYYFGNWQVL